MFFISCRLITHNIEHYVQQLFFQLGIFCICNLSLKAVIELHNALLVVILLIEFSIGRYLNNTICADYD